MKSFVMVHLLKHFSLLWNLERIKQCSKHHILSRRINLLPHFHRRPTNRSRQSGIHKNLNSSRKFPWFCASLSVSFPRNLKHLATMEDTSVGTLKSTALQKGWGCIVMLWETQIEQYEGLGVIWERTWGWITRAGENGAMSVRGKCVLPGTGLQDTQDSTTDSLCWNGHYPSALGKNLDSVLVGRAVWLGEYSGCLFHYHCIVNNYWQDSSGLAEAVIDYRGFQSLPRALAAEGLSWCPQGGWEHWTAPLPAMGQFPVPSGVLMHWVTTWVRCFIQQHRQKNGTLSLKTCHGQGRES